MNILMVTNTFTPHVGGVARSVEAFTRQYRRLGHRVLVVAPTYDETPEDEFDVIRAPAIQNFNGSDFSLPFPVPGLLYPTLKETPPDVVHSHHPFLLGDTALRVAAAWNVPIVFTHHTLYDQYTHYLASDSDILPRIAVDLACGYCNLCDGVIAPSESIAAMLREHEVEVPIEIIPTGVDTARFAHGDGARFRQKWNIPHSAFVVGHVGRLAPEKNLLFLAEAVSLFLKRNADAYFLVVGSGPVEGEIQALFEREGLASRVLLSGILEGDELADAYQAMDVFAFASQSETQGMVLTEAMAAGTPVVAVAAPGVRDVLRDSENGRMLPAEDVSEFAAALCSIAQADAQERCRLQNGAIATADHLSLPRCAARSLEFYEALRAEARTEKVIDDSPWSAALRWIEQEWKIFSAHAKAVGTALIAPAGSEESM